MDTEDKITETEEYQDRLFDGDKLVFDWNQCAFVILLIFCLQPVFTAAAQIIHPVLGAFAGTLSFYLPGICACILCLLFLLDRINYEKGGFFLRIWKYQRWNVFLFAMLVWGAAAALGAEDIGIAMMGASYRLDGYLSYMIYAGFFGCGLILSDTGRILIYKIFCGVSVLLGITSLIAMIPALREIPSVYIISLRYMRGTSIFSNIDHYGYYLVMAVVCAMGLFVYEKNRVKSFVWLAAALFNVWVLIDNTSFGPYIAVFAGLIVLICISKVKIKSFIPFISFILLSACLLPVYHITDNFSRVNGDFSKFDHAAPDSSEEENGRLSVWLQTVKLILKKPALGYGPEGLTGKFTEQTTHPDGCGHDHTSGIDRPQNEYLQHAAFMGIPALLFYLAAMITMFVYRIKNIHNASADVLIAFCAVAAYLISAFFGNTVYYTAPFFFMLLGMAANTADKNKDAV